jgi:lysine 6-dehydrogenase
MGYRYAVIGSGRQGTAAAYDFAKFGDADDIVMADVALAQAKRAAARVNKLVGRSVASPLQADAAKPATVLKAIKGVDVLLSGVPYFLNLGLAKLALKAKVSMVDFGGNTDIVRKELALDAEARKAGVGLIPDCGMGPGLNITMGVYAMELLEVPEHVYIYDGGLPQRPQPPWNYELTFNVEGLTNEYSGDATFLRDGRIARVPLFSEFELVDVPPLGQLEAIVTPGGLSTAPWSFQGKLKTLQNKTLRYPGHWAQMQAFQDLGMFDLDPVEVDGRNVIPRHVFHALFEPKVTPKEIRDVCVERARVLGMKDRHTAEAVVELVDYYDAATGFTSMERLTGWHAAIAAEMLARGTIPPGTHPVELGIPARPFVEEARKRGLNITERVGPV